MSAAMRGLPTGWRIENDTTLAGRLAALSFQRYPRPTGALTASPTSYGALPIGVDAATGDAVVPLDAAEALWVGLSRREQRRAILVRIAVETDRGVLDISTGRAWRVDAADGWRLPPDGAIDGISSDGGRWPITRQPAGDAPLCLGLMAHCYQSRSGIEAAPVARGPTPLRSPGQRGPPSPSGDETPASDEWRLDEEDRIHVRVVSSEEFVAATGLPPPPPLDPNAAYRGWRLP